MAVWVIHLLANILYMSPTTIQLSNKPHQQNEGSQIQQVQLPSPGCAQEHKTYVNADTILQTE